MSSKRSERRDAHSLSRRGWILIGVFVLSVGVTSAQRKTFFNPAVSFGASATNNVEIGEVEANRKDSDFGLYVGVELPVVRVWRGGRMQFSYTPSYLQYDDRDEFDHDEQRLRLSVSQLNNVASTFGFDTSYISTQQQGNPLEEGLDSFVSRRQDRKKLSVGTRYIYATSKFWSWEVGLRADFQRFDDIEGFEPDPTAPVLVQERDTYSAGLGFDRVINQRVNLGLGYRFRRAESAAAGTDLGGTDDTNILSMDINQVVRERVSVKYQIGAFRNTGDDSGPDEENSGILVGFGYNHEFEHFSTSFTTEHQPKSEDSLIGTSTNTSAEITVATRLIKRWKFETSLLWEERNPADPELDNRAILAAGLNVERLFRNSQAIRLSYVYVDQWGAQRGDFDDPPTLDLRVGYVWYPLKRTSIGAEPPAPYR